uniref:Uncharacterized protein TCIL3000_3_210 n=1 Tax=Trypanosoma congolense (strain IL3000) TaxID=1068625 RepID=G0UJQ4_TRYCI|nr:unnamed protein product [Trypanosoma congolense IL3000]
MDEGDKLHESPNTAASETGSPIRNDHLDDIIRDLSMPLELWAPGSSWCMRKRTPAEASNSCDINLLMDLGRRSSQIHLGHLIYCQDIQLMKTQSSYDNYRAGMKELLKKSSPPPSTGQENGPSDVGVLLVRDHKGRLQNCEAPTRWARKC